MSCRKRKKAAKYDSGSWPRNASESQPPGNREDEENETDNARKKMTEEIAKRKGGGKDIGEKCAHKES